MSEPGRLRRSRQREPKRGPRAACAGWLLAALALWPLPAAAQRGGPGAPGSRPRIGSDLGNLTFCGLDGAAIRPQDWKGRLLVLACVRRRQLLSRNLLRDLQAEYQRLRRQRIGVLAVALGRSSAEYWRRLAGENGIQFPLALDPQERLPATLGLKALPVTLVVDRDQKVAAAIFLHRPSFRRDLWRQLRLAELPGGGNRRRADAGQRDAALRAIQRLVRAGRTEAALRAISRLRSRYGRRFGTRMRLGQALLELGRPAAATEDFLAARQLEPASRRAKLWLGIARARSGDDRKAERLLQAVADLLPDRWRADGELGLIAQRRGEGERALRLLRRSVSGQTGPLWTTGSAWVGAQAPPLAVIDLDGKPVRPTASRPGRRAGVVLFWMSGDEASRACLRRLEAYYERVGQRGPAPVAINVDRAGFSAQDRARVRQAVRASGAAYPVWLDDGLESFARYDVAALPTTVFVDERGVVRQRIVGGARAVLDTALLSAAGSRPASCPAAGRSPQALARQRYLATARRLARQGRVEAAVACVRRALGNQAGPPGAVALLGRLLAASGRLDEAVELLERASGAGPAHAGLATVYADCLARAGLLARAEQWYHRALEVCSDYAPARGGLGRLLLSSGRRDQALRELRRAVKLNPHGRRALAGLGQALEAAGCRPEAIEAYAAAYRARWAGQRAAPSRR